ncbi:MAG TPA: cytochrome c3 family protein, partial [Saprospiraceae bacterium]|nr:cytochrome c3 family protein [Saprospiraceae bacterium]
GDCAACHSNGNYSNTPNTCNGCHNANYVAATNPNHVALGLSTNCVTCHTTAPGWSPATFAVHNNYYPLTGAHAINQGDCAACHANGNYSNTPNTCNGCHNANYVAAMNPNHVALGLSTNCVTCHTTAPNWSPALFPVHNNYYPLVGAHAAIASNCTECHNNGNYNNTPNTCYGCHASEYNSANNPNHVSAGFPTTCASCHSQNAWEPSTWDHDDLYFPIYSGKHKNKWDQCSDCHTNATNYSIFSCLGCHPQGPTNNDHNGVNGYQYNSNACYACHPTGDD